MVTVLAEGVDYSSTPNADWDALAAAIVAQGKRFVGRYAVADKSPAGRGITAAEHRALTAHGLDTFLYYEEDAGWMNGGAGRGATGAAHALDVVRAEGMPIGMPVHYSCDTPPEETDFAAVVACLQGAASVVGWPRVAFYGGWDAIDAVMAAGLPVAFYTQTLAWQDNRGLHPGIHLHQWGFNHVIRGVECDDVAALQPHFGQASDDLPKPTTTTTTTTPDPHPAHRVPAPDTQSAQGHVLTQNTPTRFRCLHGGRFKTAPSRSAPDATETPYAAHQTYTFGFRATVDGEVWLVSKAGSWAPLKNFEQEG